MSLFTFTNAAQIVSAVNLAVSVKTSMPCRIATVATQVGLIAINHKPEKVSVNVIGAMMAVTTAVSIYRTHQVVKNKQFKKEIKVGLKNMALMAAAYGIDKVIQHKMEAKRK